MEDWVKIRNYKCFGDEPQGFEQITSFNVIVGRNGSGKSSLLDLVAFLTKPGLLPALRPGARPEVLRVGRVSDIDYKRAFPSDTTNTTFGRFSDYGAAFLNKVVSWRINEKGRNEFISIEADKELDPRFREELVSQKQNPLAGKIFRRLSAERNISPEPSDDKLELDVTGAGATNIIQHYLNDSTRPSELIERDLLHSLNEIFQPDAIFTRIRAQRLPNANWEVFLDEADKVSVALSDSGSGLKTVLLVLLLILVVPHIERQSVERYVYGLEELENNTHPALQRRLLLYLHRLALEKNAMFFLTTHSTVAIDFFSRDEHSQLLHVVHDKQVSRVKRVKEYERNRAVLDDLDIRASDMLQSNGLVWLEGPSDRLYFRRWVELWSQGRLVEGIHYQCLFYGGKLLKHISCDDPGCDPSRVQVLSINRNAIILIDSDLRVEGKALPATKQRIVSEMERVGGIAWVTAGKEIENYIPEDVVTSVTAIPLPRLAPTDTLWDKLNGISPSSGDKLERDKISFAESVVPLLLKEELLHRLDLSTQLPLVCDRIAKWNGLSIPPAT